MTQCRGYLRGQLWTEHGHFCLRGIFTPKERPVLQLRLWIHWKLHENGDISVLNVHGLSTLYTFSACHCIINCAGQIHLSSYRLCECFAGMSTCFLKSEIHFMQWITPQSLALILEDRMLQDQQPSVSFEQICNGKVWMHIFIMFIAFLW